MESVKTEKSDVRPVFEFYPGDDVWHVLSGERVIVDEQILADPPTYEVQGKRDRFTAAWFELENPGRVRHDREEYRKHT